MPNGQTLTAALIVAACALYALWTLLPMALRRACAVAASRLRWPTFVATRLRRAAQASRNCGCDGCDKPAPAAASTQPVRFHPRR